MNENLFLDAFINNIYSFNEVLTFDTFDKESKLRHFLSNRDIHYRFRIFLNRFNIICDKMIIEKYINI